MRKWSKNEAFVLFCESSITFSLKLVLTTDQGGGSYNTGLQYLLYYYTLSCCICPMFDS
uniref:Uncharacterized protein n=1 Tax=Anguilla anguilla TaxID=7936 RepID=A0A0E9VR71_ANGAN